MAWLMTYQWDEKDQILETFKMFFFQDTENEYLEQDPQNFPLLNDIYVSNDIINII